MKKSRNIILGLLLVLLCSCNTELPMPIVGYYRVSDLKEQTEAYYYLAIETDNTFTLYQAGGAASSEPFIFKGKWSASLTSFDFLNANGNIKFYDVEGPENILGLALTVGKDNDYKFYWQHDRDTADATLSLESNNKYYSKDISTGFNIPEEEFRKHVPLDSENPNVEGGGESGAEVPEGDQSNEG